MTNLRDWQKKASFWAPDYMCETKEMDHGMPVVRAEYVDLLLQIIEKQSAVLDDLSTSPELNRTLVGASVKRLARTTKAEVQGLVEKLVKDE